MYEFSCKSVTFRNAAYDARTSVMLGEVFPALKHFFLPTVASYITVPEILLLWGFISQRLLISKNTLLKCQFPEKAT